jgi:hypothetical protein
MNDWLSRYLVPEVTSQSPDGWTTVDQRILSGLPVSFDLNKILKVKLVVPTGLAREWLAADSAAVVTSSDAETAPHVPEATAEAVDMRIAPAALHVRAAGVRLGTIPLRAGITFTVAQDGTAPAMAEILILKWRLCAGNLRGAGDFGSFVQLAWHAADQGVARFGPPPISEFVRRRLPPAQRIESRLGLIRAIKLKRFLTRRDILK